MITTADVDVKILFLIKLEVCKIEQRLSVNLGNLRINVQLPCTSRTIITENKTCKRVKEY